MISNNPTSSSSLTIHDDRDPVFVGRHPLIARLRSRIHAVCRRKCTILIVGESGTGKELAARQIHAASPRAAGPFIAVDCTTLRDTLLESQLFGHEKGAFTGAEQATLGLFRAAEGGTLFLDEVGELHPTVQAKLLRCIQDSAVVPLGGIKPIPVNVRIIAATHRNLRAMTARGEFREDLYFRLDVVTLETPPLRERPEDIEPLLEHFLAKQADMYQEPLKTLSGEARKLLQAYGWPGNVRELRNLCEQLHILSAGPRIEASDLPENLVNQARKSEAESRGTPGRDRILTLETVERCMIQRALRMTSGNQTRAADMLGVERHRLGRLIRRHGLGEQARTLAI